MKKPPQSVHPNKIDESSAKENMLKSSRKNKDMLSIEEWQPACHQKPLKPEANGWIYLKNLEKKKSQHRNPYPGNIMS